MRRQSKVKSKLGSEGDASLQVRRLYPKKKPDGRYVLRERNEDRWQLCLISSSEMGVAPHIAAEVEQYAQQGIDERGAVFTRPEVVEFILDLMGYTADKPLHHFRILEPSFGEGGFLSIVLKRLLVAFQRCAAAEDDAFERLRNALCAVELHRVTFRHTRKKLAQMLELAGFDASEQEDLLGAWLKSGDFLLEPIEPGFHFVAGNPPYVRQELIPEVLLKEYRRRFSTVFDRADIYIPFLERSLSLLKPGGALGFICSDRWMKNKYGGPLRQMIADGYTLRFYVDMVDTAAFHSDVTAYPAITVFARERSGVTRIAHRPPINPIALTELARAMVHGYLGGQSSVRELNGVVSANSPWILESSDQIAILRRLEEQFPVLEEAGCKVGIGVATGADDVFIAPYEKLNVEDSRKLPLVTTRDISGGSVKWRGLGVVNPFNDDGSLVRLEDYPELAAYLDQHSSQIKARHVSKRNPAGWYRTIDRITPALAKTPKLLIPDIKGEAHIVYESGRLYPHHNLYYITSTVWDLKALRALLMSGIARLFIAAYSTRMRGGFLRFQAQYLRRIRIPPWREIPNPLRDALMQAADKQDVAACNAVAFRVYGFTKAERLALGGNGD